MKLSLSNFNAQNTPVLIRAIGNWCILIAALCTAIITYHLQNPDAFFPAFLLNATSIGAIAGIIGKVLSMFAGVTSVEELTKLVNQTNKHLDNTSDDSVPLKPLTIKPTEGQPPSGV